MTRFSTFVTLAAGLAAALGAPLRAAESDAKALAVKARAVLKQHCSRCHHGEGSDGGDFDVLKDRTLSAARDGEKPYVVAGKPGESYLFQRVEKGSMPPRSVSARPSDDDTAALRQWIEAGAPSFPEEAGGRPHVSQKVVLAAVRDHLRKADADVRPFLRYFSLSHLHNNPKVAEAELRTHRAALSKALNSLSWKPRIVLPRAVDRDQAVFALDVRELDWDKRDLWNEVLKGYPYGLRYDTQSDRELQDLDAEVSRLAGSEIPVVRADWFVATATRPPLYHTLLELPKTAGELETLLRVDVAQNFLRDRVERAGFRASGVSGQNRLVERHEAAHGAYWKSYDFKPGNPKADLAQLPLGPAFRDNPFANLAFIHDGGEIIFNLPNGLQGYLLVDGKDNRIDQGPEEVVNDSLKTSGTPAIVNGLSCMACHSHGIRPFKDVIRDGHGLFGDARRKVEKLFPKVEDMDVRVREDSDRFLATLEKATASFVRVDEDKNKDVREFPEAVGEVARRYRLTDLDLAAVAAELDFAKPEELRAAIERNPKLQGMGLRTLLQENGVVKRQDWEAVQARSQFQRVAVELGKGSPIIVLR